MKFVASAFLVLFVRHTFALAPSSPMTMSEMTPQRPDIVIVGGGSAGLTAAKFGARFGKDVMLVEMARLGGDCTWTGCVPSKALIAAAKHAHAVRTARAFGVVVEGGGEVSVDWAALKARMKRTIQRIYDEDDSPEALRKLGVTVVEGAASFLDEDGTLLVETTPTKAEGLPKGQEATASTALLVKPKYGVVVATGARPVIPSSLLGSADKKSRGGGLFITYEQVFELEEQPKKMTIIGGGPIGCEIAQAFQRLGTAVTLVAPSLLPGEDPAAGEVLERVFAKEGVRVLKGRAVGAVASNSAASNESQRSEKVLVTVETTAPPKTVVEVGADVVLVAVGREAVVDSLNLANARVDIATAPSTGVVVNSQLRTSNKRVYAAGDCVSGAAQFTHVAGFQGAIAARNLLLPLSDKGFLSTPPPACTFTSPEVARVGLSEAQARLKFDKQNDGGGQDSAVATLVRPLSMVDRALCDDDDPEGFLKIVYRKKDGAILGALVVSPCAGELASELGVAIAAKLTLPTLASVMHAYPSYAIAIQQMAAEVYYDTLEKSMPLYNKLKNLGL